MSRRQFLGALAVIATSSGYVLRNITSEFENPPNAYISGQNSKLFHQLRDGYFEGMQSVTDKQIFDCIVLGGGISGLSSIYHLEKQRQGNFLLLEGQDSLGGNSQYGSDEISKFPYGAHYLPVPSNHLTELNDFLFNSGVILKMEPEGNHFYNEDYLIHHPETKLLYNGKWHDGLIPLSDLTKEDVAQVRLFNELIEKFTNAIGSDKKKAFNLPICQSSLDSQFLKLDEINFKDFLLSHGINSEFVFWYVNYATRDDYGTNFFETSAWAGIHYFASRQKESNQQDLFTWPEGNGFLVESFKKMIKSGLKTDSVVVKVSKDKNAYEVTYFSNSLNSLVVCKTKSVISCLPHFINRRTIAFEMPNLTLEYVPWLVVNLKIPELPNDYQNIPWDSVSYHSNSLGFVRADHQNLGLKNSGTILTYYQPYSFDRNDERNRWDLALASVRDISKEVLEELNKFYPGLNQSVSEVNIWLWGHAMAKPTPGRMKDCILNSSRNISKGLYLAHTDYSGISIFEEAFYQGVRAADSVSILF